MLIIDDSFESFTFILYNYQWFQHNCLITVFLNTTLVHKNVRLWFIINSNDHMIDNNTVIEIKIFHVRFISSCTLTSYMRDTFQNAIAFDCTSIAWSIYNFLHERLYNDTKFTTSARLKLHVRLYSDNWNSRSHRGRLLNWTSTLTHFLHGYANSADYSMLFTISQ